MNGCVISFIIPFFKRTADKSGKKREEVGALEHKKERKGDGSSAA
jgi:hypothetical protein